MDIKEWTIKKGNDSFIMIRSYCFNDMQIMVLGKNKNFKEFPLKI